MNIREDYENSEQDDEIDEKSTPPARFTRSVPSFLHSTLNSVHIRKDMWHPPSLHRDISSPNQFPRVTPELTTPVVEVQSKYEVHREETFYELFYDLIFVAAAIQIGHVIQSDITMVSLMETGLLFFVTRATWSQLMAYQNRLDNSDIIHYMLYLLHAICAFLIAEHISIGDDDKGWDRQHNLVALSIAVCVCRLSLAIMHAQIITLSSKYRPFFVPLCLSQTIAAICYLFPVLFVALRERYYVLWILALSAEGFGIMLYFKLCVPVDRYVPWHMGHLIRREGTFVLLILGEAIIQLVQHPGGESGTDYIRGLTGLTTCFNVGVLYYQQQLVEKAVVRSYAQRSTSHTWMLLHIILSLFMLYFASGIKLVYDTGGGAHDDELGVEDHQRKEEILMCISAAISLGIIFLLRMQYKGVPVSRRELITSRTLSYCFRFCLSACCAGVPLITTNATHTSSILCGITSALVIQGICTYKTIRPPSRSSSSSLIESLRDDLSYREWDNRGMVAIAAEENEGAYEPFLPTMLVDFQEEIVDELAGDVV